MSTLGDPIQLLNPLQNKSSKKLSYDYNERDSLRLELVRPRGDKASWVFLGASSTKRNGDCLDLVLWDRKANRDSRRKLHRRTHVPLAAMASVRLILEKFKLGKELQGEGQKTLTGVAAVFGGGGCLATRGQDYCLIKEQVPFTT